MDSKPHATVGDAASSKAAKNNLPDSADVAFLVTHWLAHFGDGIGADKADQQAAVHKIRRAASDIASAFSSLGSYGTTHRPSFSSSLDQPPLQQNATFADVSRQLSGIPPSHLQSLLSATAECNAAVHEATTSHGSVNLVHASGEAVQSKHSHDGRTLQEAIVLDDEIDQKESIGGTSSLMQPPILLTATQKSESKFGFESTSCPEQTVENSPLLSLKSKNSEISKRISDSMLRFLDFRVTVRSEDDEIRSLQTSVSRQEKMLREIRLDRLKLGGCDGETDPAKQLAKLDELHDGERNCNRVIAQLRRKLTELVKRHQISTQKLNTLEEEAHIWHEKGRVLSHSYRDPFTSIDPPRTRLSRRGGNEILRTILSRQHGTKTKIPNTPTRGLESCLSNPRHEVTRTRKALFCTRLSHAATINCHLNYPVYCLRFDRTGRYFITGADDYLTKVFYLGAAQSCRVQNSVDNSRELKCNYGANARGAVLVCSLRGHAGVINDIDVSSDNCFLATASVDGDCRIWGLKDGCPVAILRGHNGGANMVSWSTLTPYRLVTTGADGYARMWDIREATLKRYGAMIGKRPEYQRKLSESEKKAERENIACEEAEQRNNAQNMLPPLPVRNIRSQVQIPAVGQEENINADAPSQPSVVAMPPPNPPALPPIPAGGESNGQGEMQNQESNANIVLGQFVSNDQVDEGVKLLKRYQHGAANNENLSGPGTRGRRKAVNVICAARCPLGGSFATGSDDGICRVWEDIDDVAVEVVDRRFSDNLFSADRGKSHARRRPRSADNETPLLELMGHVSAITDLAYSHSGDRILSASQKEGVIRVWSLGMNLASSAYVDGTTERNYTQIVIKLTNPSSNTREKSQSTKRRRPGNSVRTETSKVSCDVAVWTHDDARIITSQSILVKQSDTEIQPGSQFLFLWDSRTGHCLIGISGAHTMQCPVLIPHPTDSSMVCSAAADGVAKLWDWETGRCVFTLKNKVEFGPIEASDRNKISGFLDGAFSPDGTSLVLTDDCGRVTILDCLVPRGESNVRPTAWMKEQYFANDYYELFYDTNGYCIERGSEQPPHLAPRGVRCTHSGAPWPDEINEMFRTLRGPMPLPVRTCRWSRERVRCQRRLVAKNRGHSFGSRGVKVRRGVREFDPFTTIMIRGSGYVAGTLKDVESIRAQDRTSRSSSTNVGNARSTANNQDHDESRDLSSNYRWRDYEDLLQEQAHVNDDDEVDSDDEEFEPAAPSTSAVDVDESDDDEDLDLDEVTQESPYRPGSRSQGTRSSDNARRQRAQRRAQRRDSQFVEIGSDDDLVAQYVSTNLTPSGPYVRDYHDAGHFWRLGGPGGGSAGRGVRRKWLRRSESDSSYAGRKIYTPQLGDSVVYIARAHFETIKDFPGLTPPWQRWPRGAVWPIIRCCVREIRFRFPYEDYFRNGQTSIVAILTLEVTGIPELSENRDFPWPKPSFVSPTRSHLFELSIFENDKCEFVIPEIVYSSRMQALEKVLRSRECSFAGVSGNLHYSEAESHRDVDAEMEAYPATIKGIQNEDAPINVLHLRGSGFGVISVDCQGSTEKISPWDLCVENATPDRPRLSETEKKLVLEGLSVQLEKPSVSDHLAHPVDQERYSDYSRMVEISMDLMFIKKRVESDYYSTKLSAVMDVRLIRDNCIKYNGNENDLSRLATVMYEDFGRQVLTSEERGSLLTEEDFTNAVSETPGRLQAQEARDVSLRLRQRNESREMNNNDISANRSNFSGRERGRIGRQSTLESLPLPQAGSTRRRTQRSMPESPSAQRRSTRSRELRPATEVLGRISRTTSHDRSRLDGSNNLSNNNDGTDTSIENVQLNVQDTREAEALRLKGSGSVSSTNKEDDASEDDDTKPEENDSKLEDACESEEDDVLPRRSIRCSKRKHVSTFSEESADESMEEESDGDSDKRMLRSRRAVNSRDVSRNDIASPVATRARDASSSSNKVTSSSSPRTRYAARSSRLRIDQDVSSSESDEGSQTSAQDEHWSQSEKETDEDLEEVSVSSADSTSDGLDRGGKGRRPAASSVRQGRSQRKADPTPSQRSSPRRTASKTRAAEAESIEPPSPPRRSHRKPANAPLQSYAEASSDFEPEEYESDDESEEEQTKRGRAVRKVSTYAEIPSDFDDDDSFHDEHKTTRPAKSRKTQKRRRDKSNTAPSSSKRTKQENTTVLPEVKPWPDIDIKAITKVSEAVLKRVRDVDVDLIFAKPVIDVYPELERAYSAIISEPMDLRTIEEERLHEYESIKGLQQDLILIFRNCCIFNKPNSSLWKYSRNIWEKLTDIFRDACEEWNVLLPRRF